MRKQILYYALRYQGEWHQIAHAIERKEPWEEVAYAGHYVTLVEEHYPSALRRLQYAPWILFYEGNLALVNQRCVAIVGARDCDAYGEAMCRCICTQLKNRCVIVSGMAKGIDTCAHRESMDTQSIGVIGCGLNVIYPKENVWLYEQMKQRQLLLSEYPNNVKPLAHHFPWRNRLIAALSDAVIVVQARARSGTLLTVNEALALDIPIYCVPHSFMDERGRGCNLLISQGANILVDEEDILAIL